MAAPVGRRTVTAARDLPPWSRLPHSGTNELAIAIPTTALWAQTGGERAVPVGSFSNQSLKTLQSLLGYLPLGAHQSSALVAGSSVAAPKAVTMTSASPESAWSARTRSPSPQSTVPRPWGQRSPVSRDRGQLRVRGHGSGPETADRHARKPVPAILKIGEESPVRDARPALSRSTRRPEGAQPGLHPRPNN